MHQLAAPVNIYKPYRVAFEVGPGECGLSIEQTQQYHNITTLSTEIRNPESGLHIHYRFVSPFPHPLRVVMGAFYVPVR